MSWGCLFSGHFGDEEALGKEVRNDSMNGMFRLEGSEKSVESFGEVSFEGHARPDQSAK